MATPTRRQSFPSKTLQEVDVPKLPQTHALIKHGKYVVAGGVGIWAVDVPAVAMAVVDGPGGWVRKTMIAAIGFHAATVIIFLYLVLFLPWVQGYMPNYPRWQQSLRLRVLVPALTATILLGWTCLVIALSQAGKLASSGALDAIRGFATERLGLVKSIAGATAVYTLTFGLLGFIPTPEEVRKAQ